MIILRVGLCLSNWIVNFKLSIHFLQFQVFIIQFFILFHHFVQFLLVLWQRLEWSSLLAKRWSISSMSFRLGLLIPRFFIWFIMLLLIPCVISLGPWSYHWVLLIMMIVSVFIFSLGKLITIRSLHKTGNIDLYRLLRSAMMRNRINLMLRLFCQSNSFGLYLIHISFCDCLPGLIIVMEFSIVILIGFWRSISIILDYANIVEHFIIPLFCHTSLP